MRGHALLGDVDFRRFFLGQSVSLLGSQFTVLALPLAAVLTLGAGPTALGALTAAGLIPNLLFSLWAGAWVDRHGRRRRIMLVADLVRAAVLVSIPVAYLIGRLTLTQLYLAAFVTGCAGVFFAVSYQSLLVAMVARERYVAASSWLSGSQALTQTVGLSLGGAVVGLLTAPVAVLLDAASFLVSAAALGRIHPVEPPPDRSTTLRRGILDGARWIAGHRVIRTMMLASGLTNFAVFMTTGVLVLYAVRTLALSPLAIGLAFGAGAIGGFVGALTCQRVESRLGLGRLVVTATVAYPTALLIYPAARGPVPLAGGLLALGELIGAVTAVWADIGYGAVYAREIPDRLRSRVMGAYRTVSFGVRPLGALTGGVIASHTSTRTALWISACAGILGGLTLLRKHVLAIPSAATANPAD